MVSRKTAVNFAMPAGDRKEFGVGVYTIHQG